MERYVGQVLNEFDVRVVDNSDPLGYTDKNGADNTTTITVRNNEDSSVAVIYSIDDINSAAKSNPFTTDEFGRYDFYAPDGRYDIIINEGLQSELTLSDILLLDVTVLSQTVTDNNNTTTATLGTIQTEVDNLEQTINDLDAAALAQIAEELDTLTNLAEDAPQLTQDIVDLQISRIADNILTHGVEREAAVNEATNISQATLIQGVTARLGTAEASIIQTDSALATLDQAVADRIVVVNTRFDGNEATVATLQQTVTNNQSATAQSISTLSARVGTNESDITSNATAIANETSARAQLATTVSTQGSSISTLQTSITNESQTRASQLSSVNSSIDGIQANITTINATIASNDSFARSAISQLQTSVTDNTNNISSANLTLSSHSTDLGNLFARAYLGVNVNGRVSGIHIAGSSTQSQIVLEGNIVAIRNPSTGNLDLAYDGGAGTLTFSGELRAARGTFNGTVEVSSSAFRTRVFTAGFSTQDLGTNKVVNLNTTGLNITGQAGRRNTIIDEDFSQTYSLRTDILSVSNPTAGQPAYNVGNVLQDLLSRVTSLENA